MTFTEDAKLEKDVFLLVQVLFSVSPVLPVVRFGCKGFPPAPVFPVVALISENYESRS